MNYLKKLKLIMNMNQMVTENGYKIIKNIQIIQKKVFQKCMKKLI